MRYLNTALLAACLFVASCNNTSTSGKDTNDTNKATGNKTITDDTLYPFMLGGVYFFHGYGGARSTMDELIVKQMDSKPGDAGFLKELQSMYSNYFIYPFKKEDGAGARQTLEDFWEITDAASYKTTMDDLISHGHQEAFQKTLAAVNAGKAPATEEKEQAAFVQANKSAFPSGGIKSWDIARYVNNTAMGYAAGYITKEEGEAMLAKLPAMARASYENWDAYWTGYNLGRKYWGGDVDNDAAFDKDTKEMQQGDYSLYEYMPFK